VIRENFALRFWEIKAGHSLFAWFGKEYHFREKARPVVSWGGTKYVWGEKKKGQYRHYWRAMWGNRYNE
jgi:hypothetical protein